MPDNELIPAHIPVPSPPKLSRKRTFSFKKDKLVEKILKEYNQDLNDRYEWSEQRLQRYAKLRGWLEVKTQPWDGASNAHIPLMMTDSQRTQDTLVNAVIGQRPAVSASAINKADQEKQDTIDGLIDYQLFVEQNGEEKLQEFAANFVDDGTAIAFIPYIKDDRKISDVRTFPALNQELPPEPQLQQILAQSFPDTFAAQAGDDPWGWTVRSLKPGHEKDIIAVEFYTDEDDRLVLVAEYDYRVFDGPCFLPKPLEDVVVPSRAANCQMPSQSNPNGADHVCLLDYPTLDELKRLHKTRYYDQITDEELDAMSTDPAKGEARGRESMDPAEHKIQRDALAGQEYGNADSVGNKLTRITYFGLYDVDGDGLLEDVIFTVIKEHKKLLKVALLGERFPAIPPRRPFVEARFLPVQGEFYAIGLLELVESLHDVMKALLDQTLDKNTLVNTPWFLYRAASGMRPEVIKMAPGEGYPVSNPGQDMAFPQIPNADQSVSLNMLAILQQWADKQTVIGDLQLGRVPQGKASALRTVSGMMSVLQQGDARPERILRRFFKGVTQIYEQFHELNQAFLPPMKQYKVASMTQPGTNPYRVVDDPSKIRGRFQFEFKANSLNTNKGAQAQVLQGLAPMLINGMTLQMGMVTPENVYNLLKDTLKTLGQDDLRYLTAPAGYDNRTKLTADEVLFTIVQGQFPSGAPQEGPQGQLKIFQDFLLVPEYQQLDRGCQVMLKKWMQDLQQQVMQQSQHAMQAQGFAQMMSGGGGGTGGAQPGPESGMGAGQLSPQGSGQLMDESLPGAGGGGNAGAF